MCMFGLVTWNLARLTILVKSAVTTQHRQNRNFWAKPRLAQKLPLIALEHCWGCNMGRLAPPCYLPAKVENRPSGGLLAYLVNFDGFPGFSKNTTEFQQKYWIVQENCEPLIDLILSKHCTLEINALHTKARRSQRPWQSQGDPEDDIRSHWRCTAKHAIGMQGIGSAVALRLVAQHRRSFGSACMYLSCQYVCLRQCPPRDLQPYTRLDGQFSIFATFDWMDNSVFLLNPVNPSKSTLFAKKSTTQSIFNFRRRAPRRLKPALIASLAGY